MREGVNFGVDGERIGGGEGGERRKREGRDERRGKSYSGRGSV